MMFSDGDVDIGAGLRLIVFVSGVRQMDIGCDRSFIDTGAGAFPLLKDIGGLVDIGEITVGLRSPNFSGGVGLISSSSSSSVKIEIGDTSLRRSGDFRRALKAPS